MDNKEIIEKFYLAFKNKEGEKMISCYHPDVMFSDPAFGVLKGDKAKEMWLMLLENGKDLSVSFSNIKADANGGSAHWEADYTFSRTGKKVHNSVDARFKFKEGLIIEHIDDFNLRRWASQALGLKGKILGGTSFFKRKLNQQAGERLRNFINKKNKN